MSFARTRQWRLNLVSSERSPDISSKEIPLIKTKQYFLGKFSAAYREWITLKVKEVIGLGGLY